MTVWDYVASCTNKFVGNVVIIEYNTEFLYEMNEEWNCDIYFYQKFHIMNEKWKLMKVCFQITFQCRWDSALVWSSGVNLVEVKWKIETGFFSEITRHLNL